jgi:hypothetical protein
MNSNSIRVISNCDPSKKDLPEIEKLEIKYGCEDLEERDNFIHSNFLRFKIGFELKFAEFKVCFLF